MYQTVWRGPEKSLPLSLQLSPQYYTQSHLLMASFCSHSVHTKPLPYGFTSFVVHILCTQSHFLMASFCSHSVHTKPLPYRFILLTFCAHKATSLCFILLTFCAHKATYLWLHFVDILCTQSHFLMASFC